MTVLGRLCSADSNWRVYYSTHTQRERWPRGRRSRVPNRTDGVRGNVLHRIGGVHTYICMLCDKRVNSHSILWLCTSSTHPWSAGRFLLREGWGGAVFGTSIEARHLKTTSVASFAFLPPVNECGGYCQVAPLVVVLAFVSPNQRLFRGFFVVTTSYTPKLCFVSSDLQAVVSTTECRLPRSKRLCFGSVQHLAVAPRPSVAVCVGFNVALTSSEHVNFSRVCYHKLTFVLRRPALLHTLCTRCI